MRPLVLALAMALALAGCVGSKRNDDPVPERPPTLATTEETTATELDAETNAAPSSPESAPTTNSSAAAPTPAPPASQPPAPPAPPQPAPWTLNATAKLGWALAAGARADELGQAHEQGETDAEHCPDATFALPGGATELTLASDAQVAAPGEPRAGAYRLVLTAPDGNKTILEPPMPDGPGSPGTIEATLTAPLAGPWTLHAEPIGPAVQQVWDVALEADGLALVAPATLALASAC